MSVFLRDGDQVFHTYSAYARGADLLLGTYNYLDLTALGRQEDWEQPAAAATVLSWPGCVITTSMATLMRLSWHDL